MDGPVQSETEAASMAGLPVSGVPEEKLNVLLVDDNPGKLLTHESVLQELGENIITASSGYDALHKMLRHDFAVVLLDVNMPGLDGFETAELIRKRPKFEQIPIIFVTAYNTSEIDRLRGYTLGAVDYLYLPIVPEVLKAKVKAFVDLARQNHTIRRQADHLAFNNREQSRQLQVIQELNRSLLESNRELESFSYTISHDLRAPLRSLRGFSELLLESTQLDPEALDFARRIHRASVALDRLTRDLLDYSHLARIQVNLEPVRIENLIEQILKMDPSIPPDNLSRSSILHPVIGHASLLVHSLANLIGNGLKFTTPGTKPHVHISTELREDKVQISVTDNGIGIDPACHRRIFGLFERVGDVRSYEGTGIGLAIVARAVDRMHGNCGVESLPGQGSRFWIELPAASQEDHPIALELASSDLLTTKHL